MASTDRVKRALELRARTMASTDNSAETEFAGLLDDMTNAEYDAYRDAILTGKRSA